MSCTIIPVYIINVNNNFSVQLTRILLLYGHHITYIWINQCTVDYFGYHCFTGGRLPVLCGCSTYHLTAAILQRGSSTGVRVWVCASAEAHRVSHVSRRAAVLLLLLLPILNTLPAPVDVCRCCAAVPHTT